MVERRKHKRYHMPRGTFAILRNELDRLHNHKKMSIGEIAMLLYKSEPEVMGQVTDMSVGGIAFDGGNSDAPGGDHVELDLLFTEQGIYLHNIPYASVPNGPAGRGKKKKPTHRANALRFKRLDSDLKDQLCELLAHHVG